VKVDGKTRRDHAFPLGIMDVLSIEKTNERFRILYDCKGRFLLKSIKEDESKFKLCRIKRREMGPNRIPYIVTHDGRTIRYPHPDLEINDTIKLDLNENKVVDSAKFEIGNVAYITGGNNIGRVGIITARDRHHGGFDIIHIKDANGKSFATRMGNVFVIGKGKKPFITLPKDNGLYLTPVEKK
jgi:small subunit ribosomal protein S4e